MAPERAQYSPHGLRLSGPYRCGSVWQSRATRVAQEPWTSNGTILKFLFAHPAPCPSSPSRSPPQAPVLNAPHAFSFASSLTPLAASVQSGSFASIQFLMQEGNTDWGTAAKEAAIYGHKVHFLSSVLSGFSHLYQDILEWIVAQGCPLKGDEMAAAALNGHDEVFKWLAHHVGAVPVTTAAIFAKRNSPEMVRYCLDAGVPLHADLSCMAAYGGNLALLKQLRRWDCPWDHRTLTYSIESNHTEIFNWVHLPSETGLCPSLRPLPFRPSATVVPMLLTQVLFGSPLSPPQATPRFTMMRPRLGLRSRRIVLSWSSG